MGAARATLRVLEAPDMGRGGLRYEVECPRGLTYLLFVPGEVDLPAEHLKLVVAYRHEEECGRCDLSAVFAQGDPALRRAVDAAWVQMTAAAQARL
jgi:hypothetical protein